MESGRRPLNVLMSHMNNTVRVKLKNNMEYGGKMAQCDNYMNLILSEAAEYNKDGPVANYGHILIRGNNILYINITPA